MLDGFGSGERGAAHPFGRACVDGYGHAGVPGGRDGQLHLLQREGGVRARKRAPAVVAVELDPIGAVADLVAHHAREAIDAVGFFGALRDAPFERESLGGVAAGGDDGARRGEHARTRNDALVHGLLELDIGVAGALGAQVAHGGEAGHERGAQVVDGARGAQSEALMRHLVVPDGLVVGMQEDVGMALDQARHQGGARQLDHLGAGGIDAG